MSLFKKNKRKIENNDEKVNEYKERFFNYLDSENDDAALNKIFTEITILRIKLDNHDNILVNYFDSKKLRKECEKKELIKLQFKDIIKTSALKKYNNDDYKLIDDTMQALLSSQQLTECKTLWDRLILIFKGS